MAVIFCFSGTGNSLYAANKIAAGIGADVLPMQEPVMCCDNIIGFVFPVYFFGLPMTVERFLNKIRITEQNAYIFTVITMGGIAAGTDGAVNDLLKKQGVSLSYSFKLMMVSNYLPEFRANDSEWIWKSADKKLDRIIYSIKQRTIGRIGNYSILNKIVHRSYPPLKGKGASRFSVKLCNGCGLCAKLCHNKNIAFENGNPKFGNFCDMCLRCLNCCPVNAIDYGISTRGKKRYKNRHVSVDEIINLNCKE